jgi:hypothetical protein
MPHNNKYYNKVNLRILTINDFLHATLDLKRTAGHYPGDIRAHQLSFLRTRRQ